ncbi:MAG: DUF4129 domain-containing protein [Tannerella sp.]|jgi:hypothetical protein|nr:DUF4129 domain-containing protein [Tannerella sp.]
MKFQADTIIYDINKIARYQSDKQFDYNSQLNMPEYTWFDIVSNWFKRLINSIFNGKFEENYTTPVMIFLFLAALFAVLFFLYKKRPELFMRSRKTTALPYNVEEENIHEIDFEKEISAALDKRNYRLATRLIYLQTLRLLSDNKFIDWQIHKTPTEYLYEVGKKEIKQPLRELTNHFLQVRYGNYTASPERFETMNSIRKQIQVSIENGGVGVENEGVGE